MTCAKIRPTLQAGNPLRTPFTLAAFCLLVPALVAAEIFSYQDDQGNWHFTDNPPDGYESSVVPGITTSKSSSGHAKPSADQAQIPESDRAEALGSQPVRLILPDEDSDRRQDESEVESAARSLDFPPEGSGLPPGIHVPGE
jgi:hypothetical protein